jgi:hypothetical protein
MPPNSSCGRRLVSRSPSLAPRDISARTATKPKPFYILPKTALRFTQEFHRRHSMTAAEADALLMGGQADLAPEIENKTKSIRRQTAGRQDSLFEDEGGASDTPIWNRAPSGARPEHSGGNGHGASIPAQGATRKRGPKTDLAKVAGIASRYGEGCTSDDNLAEICEALDQAGIPVLKTWPSRTPPSRSWSARFQTTRPWLSKPSSITWRPPKPAIRKFRKFQPASEFSQISGRHLISFLASRFSKI